MLANKVLLEGLISLGCHLHGLVDQCHLINEQIAEHPGTVHHHINARPSELLKGNQFQLVHPPHGIRHRLDADEPEDLSQGFAVGLDVVRTPEHAGDGFRPGALLLALAFNQLVGNALGRSDRSAGRDRLGIQSMNVLAAGKHAWVADRIAARTRQHIFTIKGLEQALHLHIGAHLLQAEAQIAEHFVQFAGINLGETGIAAGA